MNMKSFYCIIIATLTLCLNPARADERDTQYLHILRIIDQADFVLGKGNTNSAVADYRQALTALLALQKNNPGYNNTLVTFRLAYLADQIKSLSGGGSAAAAENDVAPGKGGSGGAVKLLVPGKEPRTAFRFHPKAGDKQSLEMTIKMAMGMKMGEVDTPIKIPTMTLQMDLTVNDVSSTGDIKYESVLNEATVGEDADVLPQVAEAMKSAMTKTKGLTGTGTLSNRGENKGYDLKAPADADPQLKQTLEQWKQTFAQAATPLPEEPIGVGAKWEYKYPVKSQGMTINQAMTYELASVEGENLTIKVTLAQTASNQKVQNPALQGMKVDLTKLSGTGSGDLALDLAKIMPIQVTTQAHADMTMGMNAGGQKQTMNMSMDLNVGISSK